MTIAAARILEAWSDAFGSPAITELAPGRVWEVATGRGDRFVLKQISTFGAADPVRRFAGEARILAYLRQREVPVAVPVLSDDGKACVTSDGALYVVFPMLPHADPAVELDPALFRNIGAAIARLDTALADCPFGVESWQVGPGTLGACWQTAQDRLPAAALAGLSARVRPRWDAIVQALSAAPQRVHGDVHGGNILTVGQEVTGIIDCDHLPLAPRGWDLAYFMVFSVHWYLDNPSATSADEAAPFIARHVLAGFDSVARLTRQENAGLPALALAAALGLVSYFITEHDLVEESWLRTIHWTGDNFDALRLPAAALLSAGGPGGTPVRS